MKILDLSKEKMTKTAFSENKLPRKLVKLMFANRFYTHKIDFLPGKLGDDLECVTFQFVLIKENNDKTLKSYFNDIRGLVSRIYIVKIQHQIQ